MTTTPSKASSSCAAASRLKTFCKASRKKPRRSTRRSFRPDVKIRPYYDRSDLVRVTTDTVEGNLLARHGARVHRSDFFPRQLPRRHHHRSYRSLLLFSSPLSFSTLTGEAANLLSIGAIDFGIIIDGTIVMVENIYRELGLRHGQDYKLNDVILTAARDVDRPIFYSVAVIIAGYLPIYALTGPAGKLFHPMADTMAFALLGALILTLTLVPVLASYWFKSGVKEKQNRIFDWVRDRYAVQHSNGASITRPSRLSRIPLIFGATLLLLPFIGGEFLPHLDEGAIWVRATMPYTISFEEAAKFAPRFAIC